MKLERTELGVPRPALESGRGRLFLDAGGDDGYSNIVIFCKNGVSLQISVDPDQVLRIQLMGSRKGPATEEIEGTAQLAVEGSDVVATTTRDPVRTGDCLVVSKGGRAYWRTPFEGKLVKSGPRRGRREERDTANGTGTGLQLHGPPAG